MSSPSSPMGAEDDTSVEPYERRWYHISRARALYRVPPFAGSEEETAI